MSSWWKRLKQGLSKSSERLGDNLKSILTHRKLDQETLDELEDLLISSDLGVETAKILKDLLSKNRLNKEVTEEEIKEFLASEIEKILEPVAKPIIINKKPQIILVIGVNGAGKTTTISKLAKMWIDQGLSIHMAACDTFRAAAVEQLQIWGDRLNVPVYTAAAGSDAASLAYESITKATEASADILLIDTAGRLHNKEGLMNELKKIVKVIKKINPEAPHNTLLILDATTGQNAHNQLQVFQEMIGVTGLIITKLDGTARGGVIVAIAQKFKLPIHAIGVGETFEDLRPFTAKDFSFNLVGLEMTGSD